MVGVCARTFLVGVSDWGRGRGPHQVTSLCLVLKFQPSGEKCVVLVDHGGLCQEKDCGETCQVSGSWTGKSMSVPLW